MTNLQTLQQDTPSAEYSADLVGNMIGLPVTLGGAEQAWFAVAFCDDAVYAIGVGLSQKEALADLVCQNLKKVFLEVAIKQSWRCADCGKIRPLQHHHKVHRSQGRDDSETNAVLLCARCHEKRQRERAI